MGKPQSNIELMVIQYSSLFFILLFNFCCRYVMCVFLLGEGRLSHAQPKDHDLIIVDTKYRRDTFCYVSFFFVWGRERSTINTPNSRQNRHRPWRLLRPTRTHPKLRPFSSLPANHTQNNSTSVSSWISSRRHSCHFKRKSFQIITDFRGICIKNFRGVFPSDLRFSVVPVHCSCRYVMSVQSSKRCSKWFRSVFFSPEKL